MARKRPEGLRAYLEYLGARALGGALAAMPAGPACRVGEILGALAYRLDGRHRRIATGNLAQALGDGLAAGEIEALARRVFISLGRTVVDICRIPRITAENYRRHFTMEGWEHLREAKARGRGVVCITAHFGAWELLAVAAAFHGEPIQVVVRPMDNAYLDRAVNALRCHGGGRIIAKQDAFRTALAALRRNETVGIMIDQHVDPREGVFVDFLGAPAATTTAPALLAARSGAAVLPVAIFREGRERHTISIGKAMEVERTGDLRRDLAANTARFTRAIEEFVRQRPDHWFWVHRRWKAAPLGSVD